MTIEGAWATPDGAWRVEIVRHGRTRWYQIVHGDNRIDWLGIAAVERILGEAGIDMADLVEVTDDPPPPGRPRSRVTLLHDQHRPGARLPGSADGNSTA
jgi:bifunctional non-homologous end joining protein LigD